MADNVMFCTNCGTAVGAAGQPRAGSSSMTQPAQPGYQPPGQQPAFTGWQFGAYLGLVAALAACAAAAVPAIGSMRGSRPGR